MSFKYGQSPLLSQEGWPIKRWAPGCSFGNHPSRDPLRDPAALLTQEGNLSRKGVLLLLSDQLDHVLHAAAESPLVVVPGEDFDEILSQ